MTIIAAAVIIDGVVQSLPAPNRHHHILQKFPAWKHKQECQGFIDDELGFVDRIEAADIAISEGQIEKLAAPPRLFSEDLW